MDCGRRFIAGVVCLPWHGILDEPEGERTQREQDAVARELESLKSRLSDENDAAKARRDYEYEARKQLYAELYPLAFQLREVALHAHNRVTNLALATRGGWLAPGPENWMTGRDPIILPA